MKKIHIFFRIACIASLFGLSSVARASDWAEMERRGALYKAAKGKKRIAVLEAGTSVLVLGETGKRTEVEVEVRGRMRRGFVWTRNLGEFFERSRDRSPKNANSFRFWVYGSYQYYQAPETEVELTSGQVFALSSFTQSKGAYQLSFDYRLNPEWWMRVSYFPQNLTLEGTSSVVLTSSNSTPEGTTRTLEMTTLEAGFRTYVGKSLRRFYSFGAGMSQVSLSRLDFENGTSEETDSSELSSKFSLYGGMGYTFRLWGGLELDASAQVGVILNNTPKIYYGRGLLGLGYLF